MSYFPLLYFFVKLIHVALQHIEQVYGWGTTSSGGSSSSKLLEVSVPVVTSTQCATSMGPMEDGQICAGGEAGKDSCQVR